MYSIKLTLVIIIMLVYINNLNTSHKEGVVFTDPHMEKAYKKHNITHNRILKTLYKDGKVANYFKQFNSIRGVYISSNKLKTKQLLQSHNIPVPKYYIWNKSFSYNTNINNIHKKLKPPYVIKPIIGSQGINVYSKILNIGQAKPIIDIMLVNYKEFIIEEFVPGFIHRIIVLNNKIISVVKRYPPYVIGNGVSTLRDLIKEFQSNSKYNVSIWLDTNNKLDGYSIRDVIPDKVTVILSSTVNLHNGATNSVVDIKTIHPDNVKLFKKINNITDLTLNGIDFITPDISQSYNVSGHIIEINASPGVMAHTEMDPEFIDKFMRSIPFSNPSNIFNLYNFTNSLIFILLIKLLIL